MADRTPPAVPDLSPPAGTPTYAWFGGVVEGARSGDDGPLYAAASAIERLRLGRADLEIEGSRFTLLLTGDSISGDRLDDSTKQQFISALEYLVRVAGTERPLESTLRCTEVHSDRTVETLFAFEARRVRPLSRVREVDSQDRRHALRSPEAIPELLSLGRRRALMVAAILFVIGALAIWQSGIIDQLRSVDPNGLPVMTTEFGERLSVRVVRSYGNYQVEIRRGPMFPDSDQKLDIWEERSSGGRERVARLALAGEGTAYVHLLGEGSMGLETVRVDLRPLIFLEHGVVVASLRGNPRTTGFAISPIEEWGR